MKTILELIAYYLDYQYDTLNTGLSACDHTFFARNIGLDTIKIACLYTPLSKASLAGTYGYTTILGGRAIDTIQTHFYQRRTN